MATDTSSREYTPAIMRTVCPKCGAGRDLACTMPKGGVTYVPHDRRRMAALEGVGTGKPSPVKARE